MGIHLENVCKTFDGTLRETLNGINLTIEDGEFVCVVGPSGCGKSTLLNLIAVLDEPSGGKILLNGNEIKGPGSERVVMFQEAALYPWLNVIENVKIAKKH